MTPMCATPRDPPPLSTRATVCAPAVTGQIIKKTIARSMAGEGSLHEQIRMNDPPF
jgi:hypothetical protein